MVESSRVSVIIPTKNRAADLVIAVRSLLAQTVRPAQVVVVDQSSDEAGALPAKAEFAD